MSKVGGLTPYIGKTYRRCPYSTWYNTNYYANGYNGNSTNPNLPVPTSDHDDTEGTMTQGHRGRVPGFYCMDDNCYFYTTYGYRYFES